MHHPDLNRQFQSMFRYQKFPRFHYHLHHLLALLRLVPPLEPPPLRVLLVLPLVLQPSREE